MGWARAVSQRVAYVLGRKSAFPGWHAHEDVWEVNTVILERLTIVRISADGAGSCGAQDRALVVGRNRPPIVSSPKRSALEALWRTQSDRHQITAPLNPAFENP